MGRAPDCDDCRCGSTCDDIVTLRSFDFEDGSFQWEKLNLILVSRAYDGTVYGYRPVEDTGYSYCINFNPVISPSSAQFFEDNSFIGNSTRLQKKGTSTEASFNSAIQNGTLKNWRYEMVRVSPDGSEELVNPNAMPRTFTDFDSIKCQSDMLGYTALGSAILRGSNDILAQQIYGATKTTGLLMYGSTSHIVVEVEDAHSSLSTHTKFRLYCKSLISSVRNPPAAICFRSGGVIARVYPLDDATAVEAAMLTFPGAVTATVTGGPVGVRPVNVDIHWDSASRQIEHCTTEYIAGIRPAIYSAATHCPAVIGMNFVSTGPAPPENLRTFDNPESFTSGDSLIVSGNFGLPTGVGIGTTRSFAFGEVNWTYDPNSDNWGTFSSRLWEETPFYRMTQYQATTANGEPITNARVYLTSARYGRGIASSASRRVPTASAAPYNTHLVMGSGYSWSGFPLGTGVRDLGGDYTAFGEHSRYVNGVRISNGPVTPLISVVASSVPVNAGQAASLRETDWGGDAFLTPYSSANVSVSPSAFNNTFTDANISSWYSYLDLFNPFGINSSAQTGGATPVVQMFHFTGTQSADAVVPFTYLRSRIQVVSSGSRFNSDLEWRIQMCFRNLSGGRPTLYKESSWFSITETAANVQADLDAVFGVGRISLLLLHNPAHDSQSPDLPAFQKLNDIVIRRDRTAPNPLLPLIPNTANVFLIEARNVKRIINRPLVRTNRNNGTVKWQRCVGVNADLSPEVSAGFSVLHYDTERIILSTRALPGVIDVTGYPLVAGRINP